MTEHDTKKCLDCESEMHRIRVIDHTHHSQQGELAYASMKKIPSWLTSYYKEEGRLIAYMCIQCGSIRFYGEPFSAT